MPLLARSLFFAASLCCALLAASPGQAAPKRHALLVGVTSYQNLHERAHLRGGSNDVQLMRDVLRENGFAPADITVLASEIDGAQPPTLANIRTAMQELASAANPGDFVYLHLSGHGSQQPAAAGSNEADGLDEIFLPVDVGRWNGRIGAVDNALVDDEVNTLIARIRDRGAFVWAVFDSCHSGNMTRGGAGLDEYRERKLDNALLGIPSLPVPLAGTRGGGAREGLVDVAARDDRRGGLVAFYAAQTTETTPELPLPRTAEERKVYGLFTYTLVNALRSNPGLSYRQLYNAILQDYATGGVRQTTPHVEGTALDAPAFGTHGGSAGRQWQVRRAGKQLLVGAGQLDGLTSGSRLAVLPKVSAPLTDRVAEVEVLQVGLTESPVRLLPPPEPTKAGRPPVVDGLFAVLVEKKLSFGLDVSLETAGAPPELAAKVAAEFEAALTLAATTGIALARTDPARADIRLFLCEPQADSAGRIACPVAAGDRVRLWFLAGADLLVPEGSTRTHSITVGRGDAKGLLAGDIETNLAKIAAVLKLRRIAQEAGETAGASLEVKVTRAGERGPEDISEAATAATLMDGDALDVVLRNSGGRAVDVTLLWVDSNYGVSVLFPDQGEDNRVVAGGTVKIEGINVDAHDGGGRQELLVLARETEPARPLGNYAFLAQSGISRGDRDMRQGHRGTRQGADAENIDALIRTAGLQAKGVRSAERETKAKSFIRRLSWTLEAAGAP